MTSTKWSGEWEDNYEADVLTPSGSNRDFCCWWDDMRSKEVRQLVKEAYKAGYDRGIAEWQPHEDPSRTAYVAGLESDIAKCKMMIRETLIHCAIYGGTPEFDELKDKLNILFLGA